MNTSLLKYKITIQEPVTVRQPNGSTKTVYEDFIADINASKKDLSGKKIMDGREVYNQLLRVFTVHYRTNIKDNMIVVFNGEKYKINFINELGFHDGLEIYTEKLNV